MQYTECSSNITKMFKLYGKQSPTKDILENYFEFLEEYKQEELAEVIKILIKKSKFVPTVAELISEIQDQRLTKKLRVLDYMDSKNYFKTSDNAISEYDKAVRYIETGIAPKWFKEDYKRYYLEMKKEKVGEKYGN